MEKVFFFNAYRAKKIESLLKGKSLSSFTSSCRVEHFDFTNEGFEYANSKVDAFREASAHPFTFSFHVIGIDVEVDLCIALNFSTKSYIERY